MTGLRLTAFWGELVGFDVSIELRERDFVAILYAASGEAEERLTGLASLAEALDELARFWSSEESETRCPQAMVFARIIEDEGRLERSMLVAEVGPRSLEMAPHFAAVEAERIESRAGNGADRKSPRGI